MKSATRSKVLKNKGKSQAQDFDLKEQLYNNIYIFKENFKTTLKILIDDLWNNHVSNTHFLNSMINGQGTGAKGGKDDGKNMKAKSPIGTKSTNCFEIKEAPDEDELETPLSKQRSHQGKSQSNLLAKVDEALAASLTDRPPDFQTRLSHHEHEEEPDSGARRESKSVDRTAGGARKSEERVPKAKKDINPLFHKKINVDIFAAAVGDLKEKKDGGVNKSNPRPKDKSKDPRGMSAGAKTEAFAATG